MLSPSVVFRGALFHDIQIDLVAKNLRLVFVEQVKPMKVMEIRIKPATLGFDDLEACRDAILAGDFA